jgi:hypothetical protein
MHTELWQRGEYTISTDRDRLDLDLIHDFISNHSYWGTGRAREVVQRSIENSLPFGIYKGEEQVGFARIVTDYATFAWVAHGSHDCSSTATGISPLGTVDERRTRIVRAIWIHEAAPA